MFGLLIAVGNIHKINDHWLIILQQVKQIYNEVEQLKSICKPDTFHVEEEKCNSDKEHFENARLLEYLATISRFLTKTSNTQSENLTPQRKQLYRLKEGRWLSGLTGINQSIELYK